MKYKVGDKVRVKSLDWYNENKNAKGIIYKKAQSFVSTMAELCGEIVTISGFDSYFYKIEEDKNEYCWDDWMFEENIETEVKIEVPEGYIIDEENSTFNCIKFKKKEPEVKISKLGACVLVEHPKCVFTILDVEDLKTDFDSAFKLAKMYDCGATIPTKEQWKIIYEHLNEINNLLKNKIEKEWYWTSTEHNSSHSWYVNMNTGFSSGSSRTYATRVRPIKNYRLS